MQALERTLNLVELCKVGSVDGLIPEYPVDGKIFGGLEDAAVCLLILCQAVQHAAGYRRGVRAQKVFLGL